MRGRFLSFVGSATLIVMSVHAGESATFQQQRFQLRWAETAESIAKSYKPFQKPDLGRSPGGMQFQFLPHCKFGPSSDYSCYMMDWGVRFVPPYPASLPYKSPGPIKGNVVSTGWVPIGEVHDGKELLETWRALSESGAPFDCDGEICHVMVKASDNPQQSTERTYAVCNVVRIHGVVGAPSGCDQMVIENRSVIWLKAILGSDMVLASMGLPDFSLRIRGVPPTYSLPSTRDIAASVGSALKGSILGLESETSGDEAVIGSASFRVSPVLSGWREILTVRVDLRRENWSKPETIGVTISTTIYVNRQNTDNPRDWSLPSQEQESTYINEIRDVIGVAASSFCKTAVRLDRENIACSK
jgi:hypothetical protein